jgi:glutamate racemase
MLGVVDWGIGGLGFVKELRRLHGDVSFVYLSDTGSMPYGTLSAAALRSRLGLVMAKLRGVGATRIVVACNAASTVLGPWSNALAVTGVIASGIEAAIASEGATIGVVGGARTIRSGIYRRALVSAGKRVRQRVAQPLSAAVERGELTSRDTLALVSAIVRPLGSVDALLLACTHYPALLPLFEAALPGVPIIDPAITLTAAVARDAATSWAFGPATFFTTGDPRAMERSAALAFGVEFEATRLPV